MKILLVDDESSIKRLVSDLVTDAGYDFLYAEDGLEALSIVEREHVDLIIMDVMMPHLDGSPHAARFAREASLPRSSFFRRKATSSIRALVFKRVATTTWSSPSTRESS